jgi:translation initiation factor IF-2
MSAMQYRLDASVALERRGSTGRRPPTLGSRIWSALARLAEIFAGTSRVVAKRAGQLADAADRADNRLARMARVARARARRVPLGADLAEDWTTPAPLPVARPSAPNLPVARAASLPAQPVAPVAPAPAPPAASPSGSHRPPPIPTAARPSAPRAVVGEDDWAAAILAAKGAPAPGAPRPANAPGPATSQTASASASLQALRS